MAPMGTGGRRATVEPIVLAVAQIKAYVGADVAMMGSGFFYTSRGNTYYITNRHLVIKEDDRYFSDRMSITVHSDPNDLRRRREVLVYLYDGDGNPVWREHSKLAASVDVVAVPLTPDQLRGCVIRPLSHKNRVPDDVPLDLGQDLVVIGFPKGLSDQVYNLPVARNASLASAYPVPFNDMPCVLVDARLHRGTSGSPVLTKPMNMARRTDGFMTLTGGNATYLVGIHSASLDVGIDGHERRHEDPLGLNCCWLAELLDDMTS